MTTSEAAKETVRRLYEAFDAADIAALDELVADDVVIHGMPPGYAGDADGWKTLARDIKAAMPDQRSEIDDIIAEGDRVVVRFTGRGTHKGELFGIPPSDREITVTGIEIYRLADGKVVEGWGEYNMTDFFDASPRLS
jgi:steroid delta-isomerase-like uncharacterized protein